MRNSFVAIALVLLVCSAGADTLELKDGTIVNGRYLGGTQNSVRFQVGEEIQTFATDQVLALTFTGAPPAAAAAPQKPAQPPEGEPAQTQQPAQPKPATIVIPAGTVMLVRMAETLDSRRHKTGHMFTSLLEMDLLLNDHVVVKKGSKVYGRLVQAKKSRRLVGKSQFTIQMTDIMIGNKPHKIVTQAIKAVSESSTKKTAGSVAAGAAVGGIARGSKGAKRGAAAGLGVSVLTGGKQVNIPKGTLLEFGLAQPLSYAP